MLATHACTRALRTAAAVALAFACAAAPAGCVRRTISITTTPPGAVVFLNDREVGRTPCDVEFLHYGVYDVRLRLEGFEPVVGSGRADAPAWDFIGADLFAEMVPAQLESRVSWHFDLEPVTRDAAALRERAMQMRAQAQSLASHAAAAAGRDPSGTPASGQAAAPSTPAGAAEGQGALPGTEPAAVPMPPDASVPEVPGQAPTTVPPKG